MRGDALIHLQGENHGNFKRNHIPQLLNIKEVGNYTNLSRSTIYEMIDESSKRYDPTFPKKVQLTQVRVVWVASEIAEWIDSKIAQRLA